MQGYIYIATNPALEDGLLKIGKTRRLPDRKKSLSNSSLPEKFEFLFFQSCIYIDKAENLIFKRLDYFRKNSRREFFMLPLDQAREVCHNAINEVNANPLAELKEFDKQKISEEDMFWLESPW